MQGPWTTRERVASGEPGSRPRRRWSHPRSGGWRTRVVLVWIAFALAAIPAGAGTSTSDYKSEEAGHPLRIAAYLLHPVGVVIDTLILRPAYWLGSHEPIKTLVGNTD